jgi:hypothetical protein
MASRSITFTSLGFLGSGLVSVEGVNARGTLAGDDQETALHMRMRRVGAKAESAGVSAEVVQLVKQYRLSIQQLDNGAALDHEI